MARKPNPFALTPWPAKSAHVGPPDQCDQCGGGEPLHSFELAGDDVALCLTCLDLLAAAIATATEGGE